MSRIMGFDYGRKRVGIAVTDPLQIIATELQTLHPHRAMDYLREYLLRESVSCFVVGDPRRMDGRPSLVARDVSRFIGMLERDFPDIPVVRVDERFSSKIAARLLGQSGLKRSERNNKGRIDGIAAAILLQSYLEVINQSLTMAEYPDKEQDKGIKQQGKP